MDGINGSSHKLRESLKDDNSLEDENENTKENGSIFGTRRMGLSLLTKQKSNLSLFGVIDFDKFGISKIIHYGKI